MSIYKFVHLNICYCLLKFNNECCYQCLLIGFATSFIRTVKLLLWTGCLHVNGGFG